MSCHSDCIIGAWLEDHERVVPLASLGQVPESRTVSLLLQNIDAAFGGYFYPRGEDRS